MLTLRGLRFGGTLYPCTIGRSGLTTAKREGDMATPHGVHSLPLILYRPDRMAAPSPLARPILPGDLWSDDPADPAYNAPVRAPHAFSHEALRRADPLYDLVIVTGWNLDPPVPGRGSAIFIHRWRRPGHPTAGCIALAPQDLASIARRLPQEARLFT